ncbi:hypothetical protein ACQEU5_25150 [Marinactinospora thermotolerans]|uniref:hypothetical protein n=1 Tax=Marinactinospora thermotolerans TaxID=531310 RepID=UPI003D910B91
MPHDKRKAAARALAAESGLPYTAARRAAVASREYFGGHEFEYDFAEVRKVPLLTRNAPPSFAEGGAHFPAPSGTLAEPLGRPPNDSLRG